MRRAPFLRIAHQPRGFLIELPLQVFRVGRNPHRRVVLPRPEPGGRKIAQRLAKARSGFRQQNIVLAFLLPWLEGIGGGARIIFLLRPRLGKFPQYLIQKLRGFLRRHPFMPPRWPHPVIFPFLDPVPHIEARGEGADIKLGIGLEQGGHHRLRPRPVAPRQIRGNFRRFARAPDNGGCSGATKVHRPQAARSQARRAGDQAQASGQNRQALAWPCAPGRRKRKAPPHPNAFAPWRPAPQAWAHLPRRPAGQSGMWHGKSDGAFAPAGSSPSAAANRPVGVASSTPTSTALWVPSITLF